MKTRKPEREREPYFPWGEAFNMLFGASHNEYVVAWNVVLHRQVIVLRSSFEL
jgi:hypothetical protein